MIYLAGDHRGYELKEKIKRWLTEWKHEFEDLGPFEYDPNDDYPDFVYRAAEKVSANPEQDVAIVMGNSGQGEAMVANKYHGVRAAVYYGGKLPEMVKLTKEHNHANVLSLAATFVSEDEAKDMIRIWLTTPFTFEERHVRRLKEIQQIEETGKVQHS